MGDSCRSHSKKPKMDKEGFIAPATQDIPESSPQYGMKQHADFCEPRNENGECGEVQNDNPEGDFTVIPNPHQQQQQHESTDDGTDVNMSHRPSKNFNNAIELFENAATATKMLIVQMAQNFRESEEYEALCLHNVESLLTEAQELESRLRHQKEVLQQRIFSIGRRLSDDQSDMFHEQQ